MSSGFPCPRCNALWNGAGRYCDSCGYDFEAPIVQAKTAPEVPAHIRAKQERDRAIESRVRSVDLRTRVQESPSTSPKVERIEKPAPRSTRGRYSFPESMYWGVGALCASLVMLGLGIHYNSVNEANTIDGRFGDEQLVNLPWYYDRPVLGAIVIGGLGSLIVVALIVNILKAAHYAEEGHHGTLDLSSQIHHTAWSLQGQIDEIKAEIDRG